VGREDIERGVVGAEDEGGWQERGGVRWGGVVGGVDRLG